MVTIIAVHGPALGRSTISKASGVLSAVRASRSEAASSTNRRSEVAAIAPRRPAPRLSLTEPVRRSRRFALYKKLLRAAQDVAIRHADALVASQMVDPRLIHERLDEARGIFRMMRKLPEISA